MAEPNLTLAIVTDIHHGDDRGTKMGSAALPLLEKFAGFVADLKPDCIVEMGDRISDSGRDDDIKLMREVAGAVAKIPGEWHHLLGNHDIAELTIADNEEIMGRRFSSYSIDKGGIHLVFWNIEPRLEHGFAIPFDRTHLAWLESDLAATGPADDYLQPHAAG